DSYVRAFPAGDEIMFGGMPASQWEIPLNYFRADGQYTQECIVPVENNPALPRIGDHVYKGRHSSEIFADAAIKFLKSPEAKNPFFLYIAFTMPHDPRQVPQEYYDKYDMANISVPPNFMPQHPFVNGHMKGRDEILLGFPRKPAEVKSEIRDYYASITHLDAQIGGIIEALQKSDQYENTIIIFASDNGLAVGQHGLMGKQNLYEHSIGVPMIWSGKGIPKNKTVKGHVYLNEIYPTLCEIIGAEKPASVQTRSLLPNLLDSEKEAHDMLFFAFRDLHRAVSDRKYKLIEYHVRGIRTTQLFDLETDPWEQNNLADDPAYTSVKDRLRKALLDHRHQAKDAGSPFWENF
ncbi:MAG TPA: sulfatase-like hydrolase/transferase, partial [Sphingobacterium sp.]|nr:sulfatase-like hydrolase/transferase [Sphingobacterium sp.]